MNLVLVLALFAAPTPQDVIDSVEKDAAALQDSDGMRYLSLHDIEDKENVAKIVSFTLNSLSSRQRITAPKLSDDKLFIRFNLYDYGFTKAGYDILGKNKTFKSEKLNKILGCENPILRADDFIIKSLAAGNYYRLLGVKNLSEFKDRIGADDKGLTTQAAVASGGKVAFNTQQVRRSATLSGYIWEVRDIKDRKKDFLRELLSEEYDTVQLVATNPNGLLAYYAASAKGEPHESLDADIAIDASKTVSDYTVRIARNCIFCHAAEGVIPFKDSVRELIGNQGVKLQAANKELEQKLRDLFSTELPFKRDADTYQEALTKATGMKPADFQKAFKDFYQNYYGELTLKQVAVRFGQTEEEFKNFCKNSADVTLIRLLLDGKISRARFDALIEGN